VEPLSWYKVAPQQHEKRLLKAVRRAPSTQYAPLSDAKCTVTFADFPGRQPLQTRHFGAKSGQSAQSEDAAEKSGLDAALVWAMVGRRFDERRLTYRLACRAASPSLALA